MMGTIFGLFGGIGLFLLGMILLTDGLKSFAGESLREALVKFTGTPVTACISGTLVTLLVQSSSATTVAVIGFVSAGLLTFPQALGVVLGASLGTTGTGWIVSVLGLKVSLGAYAMAIVGAGAFMKLLGRRRVKPIGLAVAGFGLIFVGIDSLQTGMQGVAGAVNLKELPSTGLSGHVMALIIGLLLTLVLQSSSAAVATTLTALHAGAVNFDQAASLVIGAAIGTTVTAALAAIGASVPAKRTALAFVLFNSATGLIALLMLPLFLRMIGIAQEEFGLSPGAISLAAFHSMFIAVGVLVFLPFVGRFAAVVEWMVPERGSSLTRNLDRSVVANPQVAMETTRRTLVQTALATIDALEVIFSENSPLDPQGAANLIDTSRQIQGFLASIPVQVSGDSLARQRISQMHAIDHLTRLQSRLLPSIAVTRMLRTPELSAGVETVHELLAEARVALASAGPTEIVLETLKMLSERLAEFRRMNRAETLNKTASGSIKPGSTLETLDAMRWVDRVGYHTWRICEHLLEPSADGPVEVLVTAHADD